jgi:NAD(P)H-dependent flavin oxidoreductase YrpB (nitropropane dioxygenase family)
MKIKRPRLRTALCQMLHIELPIIQAPIGSATCPALAAAVSNASGHVRGELATLPLVLGVVDAVSPTPVLRR